VARGVEGLATLPARDEGHRGDSLRVTSIAYGVYYSTRVLLIQWVMRSYVAPISAGTSVTRLSVPVR